MSERLPTLEAPVPAPVQRRYTYEELVAEMPETNQPSELWDGELAMSPSPSFHHQEIVLRFYRQLHDWVAGRKLGKVVAGPIDMVLSPHRVTQPDIVFIAQERLSIIAGAIHGPVDLAAEVVSLGHRHRDRIEKRDLYEQYAVKEYWLIDPEAKTVEVLHLESGHYQLFMRCSAGETARSKLLPGFEIAVQLLFLAE
jgi:Uma2 family endonuclease